MNLKFNVKDINKILVKAHYKSKFYNNKKCKETTHFYESVSMFTEGEFQVSLFFVSVVSPV